MNGALLPVCELGKLLAGKVSHSVEKGEGREGEGRGQG